MTTELITEEDNEMNSMTTENIISSHTEIINYESHEDSSMDTTTSIDTTTDFVTEAPPETHHHGEGTLYKGLKWLLWICCCAVVITMIILLGKAYLVWKTKERLRNFDNHIVVCKFQEL